MRLRTASLVSTFTLSIAMPAAAQTAEAGAETTVETVEIETILVESATRTRTPVDELSRSVTVVDREEIDRQKRIDRSIGGILARTTPGFSPGTEANSDFGQTLRGRTFLTLIDGVPQSTPLRDGRRALNSIEPDAIEQIEVVRGGTAVYGFGATGGLVNIVTRRPEDGAFNLDGSVGTEFSATNPGGSFGANANMGVSGRQGRVDYLFDATFATRGERFDADGARIPSDPLGAQGGLAESGTLNVLGKLGFQIDPDQRIEASAKYYDFEQDATFGGVSFDGDPATDTPTPAVRGDFSPVNPGTLAQSATLSYTHDDLFGSFVDLTVYYAENDVVFSKFPGFPQTRIRSEKIGSRLTIETPVEIGPVPFQVIWGLDYLRDETVQSATDAPDTDPELSQDAVAGFVQLEIPVGDRGNVTGGFRYEDISVDVSDFTRADGTFVPGGTLSYGEPLFNLTGTVFLTDNLDLYGGFSQGFTVADIGRSISDGTFATSKEAESEAQKTDNFELGLRAGFEAWDASVVGFYSTSDNGVSFDRDLNIVKQPERIWGIEASAAVRPLEGLSLGGTVTWLTGEVDLDNDGSYEQDLPTTRIPPLKVTAFAQYAITDRWLARVQGLYSGTQDPDSSQFGGTAEIDDYFIVDLYTSHALGPGRVQLGVENLLNHEYTPVINQAYDSAFAYARAPGTTVSLSYAMEF